jgi:hypothetical protein
VPVLRAANSATPLRTSGTLSERVSHFTSNETQYHVRMVRALLSSLEEILKIWKRGSEAFGAYIHFFFYVCRNCWQLWLHISSFFYFAPHHEYKLLGSRY